MQRQDKNCFPIWTDLRYSNLLYKESKHVSILVHHYILSIGGYCRPSQHSDTSNNISLENIRILNMLTMEFQTTKASGVIPPSRSGHCVCLLDKNQILLFGGYSKEKNRILDDVAILSLEETEPLSVEWRSIDIEGTTKICRYGHSAHIVGNYMYVFGGSDEKEKPTNELWRLDLDNFTWTLCDTLGTKPAELYSHKSVLYNSKIYIYGGLMSCPFNPDEKPMIDLWELDLDLMKWQQIIPEGAIPSPRRDATLTEMNGLIYFFGGIISGTLLNEMFAYDIENNIWKQIVPRPKEDENNGPNQTLAPRDRFEHTSVSYGNKLIFLGGEVRRSVPSITIAEFPVLTKEIHKDDSQNSVLKAYRKLYGEKILCDIIFEVEGQEISAHKTFLAVKCPFFYKMFTSGMKESRETKITFPDVKADTFKAMLDFIYCSDIKLNEALAMELLELSDKYSLFDLTKKCEGFLIKIVSEENYVKLAQISVLCQTGKLTEAIKKFVINNPEILQKRKDAQDLPKTILMGIIDKTS